MKTSITPEERIKVLELEIAHKDEKIRDLQEKIALLYERREYP